MATSSIVTNIMDSLYEGFSEYSFPGKFPGELYHSLVIKIRDVLIEQNRGVGNVLMVKDDTNVIVIVFDYCVIRIYEKDIFDRISEIYSLDSPNLESLIQTYYFEDMYIITVTEKIIPLLHYSISGVCINPSLDITKIASEDVYCNISGALSHIHRIGYVHRDCQLDNIGVKVDSDGNYVYVLFDYVLSKKYKDSYDFRMLISRDMEILINSIKRYLMR